MKIALLATVALLGASSAASAQDNGGEPLRIRIGLGAQYEPKYVGADSYRVSPLPKVSWARGSENFNVSVPDDNFGIPVIKTGGFSFGPAASIANKRKPKDVGADVEKVDTTFELGAFGQYDFAGSWRIRTEVRKGLGGHDGIVGQVGVDKIWRDGDRYVFTLGPRVLFSNGKYQRAYFGVEPEVTIATGLKPYDPSGGIHGVAGAAGLTHQFNDRFGMFGYARYERLVGAGSKSPIVKEYGSANQFSAGLGLSYTFVTGN